MFSVRRGKPIGVLLAGVACFVLVWSSKRSLLLAASLSSRVVDRPASATAKDTFVPVLQDCEGSNKLAPSWCLDDAGVARYTGGSNRTIYRTLSGYERCLANKTVVLVGDSRLRYQYMTLVAFLKSGNWMTCQDYDRITPPREDNGTNVSPECFLIDHEHHQAMRTESWTEWYAKTNEFINDDPHQEELCDCSRRFPFAESTTFENRFFRRRTAHGIIQVNYLQAFVDKAGIHADFPPHAPYNVQGRCEPGNCTGPSQEPANTLTFLNQTLPLLNATHVFVQPGWTIHPDFPCRLDEFARAHSSIDMYFAPHPLSRDNPSPSQHNCTNVRTYDREPPTQNIPKDWYWDRVHVLSIVNQEFNHLLLDKLCGL
jgi:hypothetical protein